MKERWQNAGYEWRDLCPLSGAERYLWKRMQRAKKGSLIADYYQAGWEFLYSIQEHLFAASSVHWGKHDENCEFRMNKCYEPGCKENASCLVNQYFIGEGDDRESEWYDDAPRFYCHAHYHKLRSGQEYVPPTEDEQAHMRALFSAFMLMDIEKPFDVSVHESGFQMHTLFMDRDYLKRLAELADREYQKIKPRIQ